MSVENSSGACHLHVPRPPIFDWLVHFTATDSDIDARPKSQIQARQFSETRTFACQGLHREQAPKEKRNWFLLPSDQHEQYCAREGIEFHERYLVPIFNVRSESSELGDTYKHQSVCARILLKEVD